jgi:Spy/CpxP family protein refolding chaperone
MRRILGIMAVVITTCLITGVPLWGQPAEPSPDPGPSWAGGPDGDGRGLSGLAARLGLSAEQENALRALRKAFLEETADEREGLRKKRQELDDLFRNPTSKDEEIAAREKELSALRDLIAQKASEYRLKARKILTPEQLAKVPPGCPLGLGMGPGPGRRHGGTCLREPPEAPPL